MKRYMHDRNPVQDIKKRLNSTEYYSEWDLLDRKQVRDTDGFLTDYSLYYNTEDGRYVTVFGDADYYGPEDGDFDAEFDSEDEALDWFESYDSDYED